MVSSSNRVMVLLKEFAEEYYYDSCVRPYIVMADDHSLHDPELFRGVCPYPTDPDALHYPTR